MKEKIKIDDLQFQYIVDVLNDVCKRKLFKMAEEFAMAYEDSGDERIYSVLNEIRFKIAVESFAQGIYNDAEDAINLINDTGCRTEVLELRSKIQEAKRIAQNPNGVPGTSRNTYASMTKKDEDAAFEEIMNDPPVHIDPEEYYRQKVDLMTWNGLVMRVIALRMEAKLALSNRIEGILDGFNKTKMDDFDGIMCNVHTNFQLSVSSLQAYNYKDAGMYLAIAEVAFLELCPEVVKKPSSKMETDPKKSGHNIFIEVKPQNYQPKERDALTVKGDDKDVMKCLKVASKALHVEDFAKAEKFCKKAERILPTQAAKNLLDQIRISKEAKKIAAEEAAHRKIKEEKEAAERKVKAAQESTERKARQAKDDADREARLEKEAAERKARKDHEAAEKKAKAEQEEAERSARAAMEQFSNPETAEEATETSKDKTKKKVSMNIDEQADAELKIPTTTSDQDLQGCEDGKMRRAEKCLVQAEEAFSNGDLNAAEKLAKKAQQIHPSAETETFLKKLHNSTSNPIFTKKANKLTDVGKKQENKAKELVSKAEECVASGDLKRAEEYLQNARESDPNVDVNKVEASLRAAKASRSSTDDSIISDHEYKSKSRAEKDFVYHFEIATNAMNAKEFVKAERFLQKAYEIKPTTKVEDLLRQVQIEVNGENNTYTSGEDKKEHESYFMVNMVEAKKLYREAKKSLKDKNYDEAETIAKQSLTLNPLNTTKVLLNQIITAKQKMLKPPVVSGDKPYEIDLKFKLLNEAQQLLNTGNLNEADNLVMQSKAFGECAETEKLCHKIKELKSKQNTEPMIGYGTSHQREEARKNFEIGQTALNDNDFTKAEHYFVKSDRIVPSKQAKAMLQKVQSAIASANNTIAFEQTSSEHTESEYVTTNSIESEDKVQVDTCIEVATKAISDDDFEKALHFLEKSQRIHPTKMAQTLLNDIQHSMQQKEEYDAKAESLIASAIEAINTEDYEFAEMLLTIAKIRYNSNLAKHLLTSLKESMLENSQTHEKKESKHFLRLATKRKTPKGTVEKQKKSAEVYYTLAHSYVTQGKLDDAEIILIIAQNTYPTTTANELLTKVRDEIYSRDSKQLMKKSEYEWTFSKKAKQGIENRNAYKSNSYVQMAERAFCKGDFVLAEDFLMEADNLYPCSQTKHLLRQVREAKAFMNDTPAKKKK